MKIQLFKEKAVRRGGLLTTTIIGTMVSGTTGFSQDLQLNPAIGQIVITYPVTLELADSSTNGTGQVWDFSGIAYDNNSPETIIYRVPTSAELNNFPQATIVAESDVESPSFYYASADSLALLGGFSTNGNLLTFGNPRVKAVYPFVSGQLYSDAASYTYMSGTNEVVVEQQLEWEIVGSGTLITPLESYNDVYKVKTSGQLQFFVNGMPNITVQGTQFEWYAPGINTALLSLSYDDYNDSTEAKMLVLQGMAALPEQSAETIGVYPNPATDRITVEGIYDCYELVDAMGRTVLSGTGKEIVLESLAPDNYTLVIRRNGLPAERLKIVKL
jgi:hypothetical protein